MYLGITKPTTLLAFLSDGVAEFFLSGNPLSCDCEMDWLPGVNAASALTASVTSGESRNPRVADLADLECSVDLGKAEAGRFKVRAGLLGV